MSAKQPHLCTENDEDNVWNYRPLKRSRRSDKIKPRPCDEAIEIPAKSSKTNCKANPNSKSKPKAYIGARTSQKAEHNKSSSADVHFETKGEDSKHGLKWRPKLKLRGYSVAGSCSSVVDLEVCESEDSFQNISHETVMQPRLRNVTQLPKKNCNAPQIGKTVTEPLIEVIIRSHNDGKSSESNHKRVPVKFPKIRMKGTRSERGESVVNIPDSPLNTTEEDVAMEDGLCAEDSLSDDDIFSVPLVNDHTNELRKPRSNNSCSHGSDALVRGVSSSGCGTSAGNLRIVNGGNINERQGLCENNCDGSSDDAVNVMSGEGFDVNKPARSDRDSLEVVAGKSKTFDVACSESADDQVRLSQGGTGSVFESDSDLQTTVQTQHYDGSFSDLFSDEKCSSPKAILGGPSVSTNFSTVSETDLFEDAYDEICLPWDEEKTEEGADSFHTPPTCLTGDGSDTVTAVTLRDEPSPRSHSQVWKTKCAYSKTSSSMKQTTLMSFFSASPKKKTTVNSAASTSKQETSSLSISGVLSGLGDAAKAWAKIFSRPASTSSTNQTKGLNAYGKKRLSSAQSKSSNNIAGYKKNRSCPFYKKIPGSSITVDAFSYGVIPGCSAYFLSHFHYDHYGGLTNKFSQPIYCSQITGNLVEKKLRVKPHFIRRLSMNTPHVIENVEVTLLDANHCPGAVMFLFKLKNGHCCLHVGDFRACVEMEHYPELQNIRIRHLYLDTTYCDPSYTFPPQSDMVQLAVSVATEAMKKNPRTLIVCGSYTIGKEKIFMGIAEALDIKICVTKDKLAVLNCIGDSRILARLTTKWETAQIHVLPMMQLRFDRLQEHLKKYKQCFSHIVSFSPTGWTHSGKTDLRNLQPTQNRNCIACYGIPYSEHSSYSELMRFVQFLRPLEIIPTVNNGNATSREKMKSIFKSWLT